MQQLSNTAMGESDGGTWGRASTVHLDSHINLVPTIEPTPPILPPHSLHTRHAYKFLTQYKVLQCTRVNSPILAKSLRTLTLASLSPVPLRLPTLKASLPDSKHSPSRFHHPPHSLPPQKLSISEHCPHPHKASETSPASRDCQWTF
jgi:hypothetical protein